MRASRTDVHSTVAQARRSHRRWLTWRSMLTGALIAGLLVGPVLVVRGLSAAPPPDAPLPSTTFDLRGGSPAARPGATVPWPATDAASGGRHDHQETVPSYGANRLGIPVLGVDAPVVPEPVGRDGDLVIPGDPGVVGRWDAGPDVEAGTGTTVMAGHVSVAGVGDGVLRDLHRLAPGDLVVTTNDDGGQRRWRVDALLLRHKDDLPELPASGPRRLALVTCGGPALTGPAGLTFRDNVIAFASPDDAGLP